MREAPRRARFRIDRDRSAGLSLKAQMLDALALVAQIAQRVKADV
jgi:hypothetical protein